MPLPVEAQQRRVPSVAPSMRAGDPEPGFFDWNTDAAKASARLAERDVSGYAMRREQAEYVAAIDALVEATGDRRSQYLIPTMGLPETGGQLLVDADAFWKRVAELRARNPGALPGLAQDEATFKAGLVQKMRGEAEGFDQRAAKGGMISRLAGGAAGSLLDPVNVATLPIGGGGKTVLTQILRAGLANAAIETVATPLVAAERAEQGRKLTLEEAGTNIGAAFVLGAGFDAGIKGVARTPQALRAATEKVVQASWNKLPQGLRDRYTARQLAKLDPLDDEVLLADMAEAIIGPDRLSDREKAAMAVVRREAALERGGPLAMDGAGQRLHNSLLAQAMARIEQQFPPQARVPRAAPNRADLMNGTALDGQGGGGTARVVSGSAIDAYMAKTRRAESGGDDRAAAGTSSAFGRYQFTKGTWLAYYKRRFGTGGLSDSAILAKRADGRLQDVLMRDLTEDNAATLRSINAPVTEGNLYLAHFLGPADAKRVLTAAGDEPVGNVVRGESIAANRPVFDKLQTAADLIAWADRKQGGRGQVLSAGGAARLDPAADAEAARVDALRSEIDAINAENARIEAELAGGLEREANPLDDGLDDLDPPPADWRTALDEAAPPLEPRAADADAPPAEVLALLPSLREQAKGRRGLVPVEQLANDLGVPAEQLDQALRSLVSEGTLTTRKADGKFMFKPPRIPVGERSLLQWIADRGGIEDRGGDIASMGGDRWHLRDKPVKVRVKGKDGKFFEKTQTSIPGRAKLIRAAPEGQASILGPSGPRMNDPESLFNAAISAGYFPELYAQRELADSYADSLPIQKFLDAIADELAGKPRYRDGSRQFEELLTGGGDVGRYWESPDDSYLADMVPDWFPALDYVRPLAQWELIELKKAADDLGLTLRDLDPDLLIDAVQRFDQRPMWMEKALDQALDSFAARNAADAFDQTGNARYEGIDYGDEEIPGFGGDFPQRLDPQLAGQGGAAARDRGGPGGGSGDAAASSPRGGPAGAPSQAGSGPDLAELPREAAAPYLDPDGPEAKAQLDSLDHDARAKLDAGLIPVNTDVPPPREGVLKGTPGMMLGKGDIVQTATGRETTPVPNVAATSDRTAANAGRRMDQWLVENARLEAAARGDDFNGPMFDRMDPKKLSPSDRDVLNYYLFDSEQPPIRASIFKPLVPEGATNSVTSQVPLLEDGTPSRLPSTDAGFEAEVAADEALSAAIDDLAMKRNRVLSADVSDRQMEELALVALNGGDVRKAADKMIRRGEIQLIDEGEPQPADIKPLGPSDLVPAPERTVKAADYAGPPIAPEQAAAKLAEWKARAKAIGASQDNSRRVIYSLFDASGVISQPFRDMGFTVIQKDIKLGDDLMRNPTDLWNEIEDLKAEGYEIAGVIAQPPCTTWAGSGARWWEPRHDRNWENAVRRMWGEWATKEFDSPTEYNQFLVMTTEEAIRVADPGFFVIENPVGRIERMAGLPKPQLAIEPHHFGDAYTKRTHLWGKFNPVLETANVLPTEGSRMHKLWSRNEKEGGLRSQTPEGFAYAFALAQVEPQAPARLDMGAAVDPNVAAVQRQAAQLGAEAPMRARTEQDGTMGSPLFDAVDQPQFLLDAGGEAKPLASLMDEMDAEAAAIKNAKDCL